MNYDLVSPEMRHDPYPTYAQMRRDPSIVKVIHGLTGQPTYFVTRYNDAAIVLKDPRFVNDSRKLPGIGDWTAKWYIPSVLKVFAYSMALADEPDHTRLRGLVHKAFTPNMIQQLTGRMEQLADDLLTAAAHKPECDFIEDFALPLPLNVIGDLLGVSIPERKKFRRWLGNNITDFNPKDRLGTLAKLVNAFAMDGFLKRLIKDRKQNPKDDLISALVQASEGADKLSNNELMAMLFLILFAGYETTVNLISSGTLALLQNPDQFEKLKANPDLLDSAIEEMLRYVNPVQHVAYRYPLEDVDINGVTIPKYSTIMVGVAAANRDETVFENPEKFDITRNPNKHLAFGVGIHYCLGAPLARLEAVIGFRALLRRFPNIVLAAPAERLQWRGAPALRGLVTMPVRLKG